MPGWCGFVSDEPFCESKTDALFFLDLFLVLFASHSPLLEADGGIPQKHVPDAPPVTRAILPGSGKSVGSIRRK